MICCICHFRSVFRTQSDMYDGAFNCENIHSFPQVRPPPPLFWETPPFWVPPSFWSKFKKLAPSFWEPSKLVHVNCNKNTLKWRCYASFYTKSIENIINITLSIFRLNSVFYYVHFLWLNIAFNVFHTWCARGMNMKHF